MQFWYCIRPRSTDFSSYMTNYPCLRYCLDWFSSSWHFGAIKRPHNQKILVTSNGTTSEMLPNSKKPTISKNGPTVLIGGRSTKNCLMMRTYNSTPSSVKNVVHYEFLTFTIATSAKDASTEKTTIVLGLIIAWAIGIQSHLCCSCFTRRYCVCIVLP